LVRATFAPQSRALALDRRQSPAALPAGRNPIAKRTLCRAALPNGEAVDLLVQQRGDVLRLVAIYDGRSAAPAWCAHRDRCHSERKLMINPGPAQALSELAARTQEMLSAYAPGYETTYHDLRSATLARPKPALDPMSVSGPEGGYFMGVDKRAKPFTRATEASLSPAER
jgi:hypothetical protein